MVNLSSPEDLQAHWESTHEPAPQQNATQQQNAGVSPNNEISTTQTAAAAPMSGGAGGTEVRSIMKVVFYQGIREYKTYHSGPVDAG